MYGNTTASQSGAITGPVNTINAPDSAPNTEIEDHIDGLSELVGRLQTAVTRTRRCADRLIGEEPTPVGNKEGVGQPTPTKIPLMVRVRDHGHSIAALVSELYRQIERLERV